MVENKNEEADVSVHELEHINFVDQGVFKILFILVIFFLYETEG